MNRTKHFRSAFVRMLTAIASLVAMLVASRTAHAGVGLLVARTSTGEERGQFPLARTEVVGEVTGRIVSVDVTQRFENPFQDTIEAVYTFPLPETAAVDQMEMHIGERVVRSTIQRRAEARAMYVQAAQTGRRAALLDAERPNVFTLSVANIDPNTPIEVRVHYFALARYDHSTYEMVFPTTVGPRYIPGSPTSGGEAGTGTHPNTERVTDASRISPPYVAAGRSGHTLGFTVDIDAGATIANIETRAHAIDVARREPTHARITLRNPDEVPDRDVVIRWTLNAPEVEAGIFASRPDPRAPGYVALLLEPKHDIPVTEIAPREIFFLLDTSGSMQGPPLDAAIMAVRRAIGTLQPTDSFQIIDFADQASSFTPRPLANSPYNVQLANAYLDRLAASGGTNQLAGIHAALSAPGDPMRLRYVVFMTDGYIGNESEVIGLVQRDIGNARIFGFGIGSSVNRYLLEEVSRAGRGAAEYIAPGEAPSAMIERFYQRIGRPYLTDIQVDWGGLEVDSVVPARIPDLSAFEPLTVMARYRNAGHGTVTVRGRIAGQPFARSYPVDLPAEDHEHAAISRIWARESIGELTRAMHFRGTTPELVGDITGIALAHNLVTEYTSLVAIDEVAPLAHGPSRTVVQPNDAPQGVNVGAAGGQMLAQSTAPSGGPSVAPPIYANTPNGTTGSSTTVGTEQPPPAEPTTDVSRREVLVAQPGVAEVQVRRHGCGSCNVGADTAGDRWAFLVIAMVAVVILTRKRRK
jgi:Ca-activated chloride channel family protein